MGIVTDAISDPASASTKGKLQPNRYKSGVKTPNKGVIRNEKQNTFSKRSGANHGSERIR